MREFLFEEFRAAFRLKRVGFDGNCNPGEFVSLSYSNRALLIPYIEIRIGDQPDDIKGQLEPIPLSNFARGLEYKVDSTRFVGGKYPHELYEFTVEFLSKYGNDGFAERYAEKTQQVIKSIAKADASTPKPTLSDGELRSESQDSKAVWKRPLAMAGIGAVTLLSSAVTLTWIFSQEPEEPDRPPSQTPVALLPEVVEVARPAPDEEPDVPETTTVVPPQPVSTKPVHLPQGPYRPDAVAFSDDGKYVAIADSDWQIKVYFAESGILAATLFGHEGRIHSLDFASDSDLLASGSSDHTARVWSVGQKKQIRIFADSIASKRNELTGTNVSFSPDDQLLAFGGADHMVYVRRIGDEATVASFSTDRAASNVRPLSYYQQKRDEACPGFSISISPECAAATNVLLEQTQQARQLEKARQQRSQFDDGVQVIAFSPDGKTIATIAEAADSDLQIFDWQNNSFLSRLSIFKQSGIIPREIAFSPSDASLYVVGKRQVGSSLPKAFAHLLKLENLSSSELETVYQAPYPTVGEVAPLDFSPDGRLAIFSIKSGFVAFDVDAQIPARSYTSNCAYHIHVALGGGAPLMLSADFCDGNGITVQPFTSLD